MMTVEATHMGYPAGFGPRSGHEPKSVIVCQDFAVRLATRRMLTELGRELGLRVDDQYNLLKFEDLQDSEHHFVSAREVVQSEIVVVAGYSEVALPKFVKRWLDLILPPRRSDVRAIVGLLFGGCGSWPCRSPLRSDLARVADSAGIRFHCYEPRSKTEREKREGSDWRLADLMRLDSYAASA